MSKLVQNQYDTILKHVKTRNENMTKYSKIEQMVHEMFALTTTK